MIAIMRRGGRARLKASDSKSDRGVSPSGVQILSPPPIVLASERLRRAPALDGRADNPRGCAGLRGSTVGQQPPWPGSAARRSGGEPARAVLANTRRGDRAAEGAALEMPCTGNPCAAGSNPAPSANHISRRSSCAGLRRSTVGQRPPWSLRRSTVGQRPPWLLRRSTVGRRPPWLALAPDGRRSDALDQF